MNDETGFLAAVLRELAASTAVILAAWGALGGATNALTTRMRLRDALRHILLGGLIAAGMGSFSMALVTAWLALPPQAIPSTLLIDSQGRVAGRFLGAVEAQDQRLVMAGLLGREIRHAGRHLRPQAQGQREFRQGTGGAQKRVLAGLGRAQRQAGSACDLPRRCDGRD